MSMLATLAYHYNTMLLEYVQEKCSCETLIFSNIDWFLSELKYQQLPLDSCLESFSLQNRLWPRKQVLHQFKEISLLS
jgi:hypothetical protein